MKVNIFLFFLSDPHTTYKLTRQYNWNSCICLVLSYSYKKSDSNKISIEIMRETKIELYLKHFC